LIQPFAVVVHARYYPEIDWFGRSADLLLLRYTLYYYQSGSESVLKQAMHGLAEAWNLSVLLTVSKHGFSSNG
jgi:hypothetical protein